MERSSVICWALAAMFTLSGVSVGSAQTEGPGRELVPSNVVRLQADTLRTSVISVAKVFIVPYEGKVRASWQIKSNDAGKTVSVTVTSLVDSCTNSTSSQSFVAQTCDLRVVAGDKVTVSATGQMDISTPGINSSVSVKAVRLRWNVVNSAGTGTTLVD